MDYLIGAIVFLIVGTGLICIGAILATGRWNLLGRYSQRKKMMPEILLGAIAIAVGGLLTTGGWNKLDTYQKRNILISAIAQEWLLNQSYLETGVLSTGELYDDTGKAWKFPLFRKSALDGLISSGLFSFHNRKDKKLFQAIISYEAIIEEINNLFTIANDSLVKDKNKAEEINRLVVNSHWYEKFKKYHKEMGDVLVNNYGWAYK
jgi:hypothetical protein